MAFDGGEFCRRYATVNPPYYDAHRANTAEGTKALRDGVDAAKRKEAAGVCRAVLEQFIAEETAHRVIDALFPHWVAHERPGLSPCRPCKPDGEIDADTAAAPLKKATLALLAAADRYRRASALT